MHQQVDVVVTVDVGRRHAGIISHAAGTPWGFNKKGTGLLTLSAANTYAGATNITGGTLALSATGSIGNSATIIVGANTTFDVSAVNGGYTLAAGQTLSGPGTVVLHRQDNPAHPDYEVYRELSAVLAGEVDAKGRPLRVIDVPAPTVLEDGEGFVDWSYINHYVANNAVVLCAFDDPNDTIAAGILERAGLGIAADNDPTAGPTLATAPSKSVSASTSTGLQ